ncbi:SEC-C metal-binding domain-containing protein [Litchfieldia alkalitelluris]|uniref:SEC-C metal-binding domain-containing protein n=1 Tax=Litchfieldia alkalitelluris TaxID=304268 RepID=UPI001115BA1E|nr:SEC-C metal-binding domain-containing protein [Litchfieldia alkalitelluris]
MDKKMERMLLNALKNAKTDSKKREINRENQLWKNVEPPYELRGLLSLLTKTELDTIRKNLNLTGVSSLKKAELADVLTEAIVQRLPQILSLLDKGRYDLIRGIVKGYVGVSDNFPMGKVEALMRYGIVFPVKVNGRQQLIMPAELLEPFAECDGEELQKVIKRNTEYIQLTHGMLYYYGVIETFDVFTKIKSLVKDKVDHKEFLEVISMACDYYNRVRFSSYRLIDRRILFKAEEIREEQKMRDDIDYYPFTRKQLLEAGKPGFIGKSLEMDRFLSFLKERYRLTNQEVDNVAWDLVKIINVDVRPNSLIEYFQKHFEFPSLEFLEQLMGHLIEVSNNTRQWVLKGYTPNELVEKENKQLTPIPSMPMTSTSQKMNTNVIDVASVTSSGRNSPCPCGSGKKHKKCCGR